MQQWLLLPSFRVHAEGFQILIPFGGFWVTLNPTSDDGATGTWKDVSEKVKTQDAKVQASDFKFMQHPKL